ncbi:MAG: SDR family oxidoreductase [Parvibaculum sp.]|uniref:SDR family NAD(P)-dependent oxidoreductase n=1 Tax=Parvibaculum sp. TaxID=2024848 RepID=UPI0025D0EAD0|nr:SDR family oxidoreductase [Parvibaculum sp.]MCE9648072.1 SDR family oxidoreductase [Parvibaculum sp.]
MSKEASKGTALVTGASSGIGAVYADRLARRGYDLLLVARDRKRLEDLAARLRGETGVAVEVLTADLTAREDLLAVEKRLRDDAAISLIVNNAGLGPEGALIGADIDYLDRMIALNVTAVNRLAIAAATVFAARDRGGIINIASVVALIPEIFSGSYSGSKAFVLNLTQALQSEVAKTSVRVQAVLPGLTRTEIFDRVGRSFDEFDPASVMDAGDLVDAALVGFDRGELVTIPSLPDAKDWEAASAARVALGPNLSKDKPADRYRMKAVA